MYYWVNLNGTYSGGRALYGNGTSWSNLRTWDAAFREYGQTVTADVPRPPVVAPIGNQTVYRDTWIEFNVTATDPNDDELTYWAENLPAGATFDAEEQFFEWKRPAVPGVYTITFKVFDGGFGVKYKVTITVKDIPQGQSFTNLCPADSYNLLQEHADDPDFVILDIRTQEEFDGGYIEGATLIDFYAEDFSSKLAALDRNKTYFIYCRTGHRTGLALNMMAELGFTNVYNLEEGITAWTEADYPTVTPGSPTPTTTPPPTSGG
jgi:rhodanese-related sulfurtransferase